MNYYLAIVWACFFISFSLLIIKLCSWELALTLKEAKERFDAAGVKLIAVGVGTPDKARILAERVRIAFQFLAYFLLRTTLLAHTVNFVIICILF